MKIEYIPVFLVSVTEKPLELQMFSFESNYEDKSNSKDNEDKEEGQSYSKGSITYKSHTTLSMSRTSLA